MKRTTKIWHGLSCGVARASAAAVLGMSLLPVGHANETGEAGESGAATHGAASEGGESGPSMFPGNLDKAISNIFAGEGGEGGAGLTPMWPSVSAPALVGSDVEKLVTGNTLRTDGHVAWYFTADRRIEGGFVDWKAVESEKCPATDVATDRYYRGTDAKCYMYTLYPSKGTWVVRDNQLCVDVSWDIGNKKDCRYVTILLDDIALFGSDGKIDGKGMKLHKGKALAQ